MRDEGDEAGVDIDDGIIVVDEEEAAAMEEGLEDGTSAVDLLAGSYGIGEGSSVDWSASLVCG